MIVENQNNAAGVQFKMLTMRSQGERRAERREAGGVWKSVVGCGKLHALYKLKPQAQRQPHHHGSVAWVLWTWTWIGIGHGRVVCAAPPAVVFVVTSLCKKHSERKRQGHRERDEIATTTMGTFHMTFLGFALCVATQLRRAQKTPDCIWASQRAVALRCWMGWDGCTAARW